jgi:hypothetical protein
MLTFLAFIHALCVLCAVCQALRVAEDSIAVDSTCVEMYQRKVRRTACLSCKTLSTLPDMLIAQTLYWTRVIQVCSNCYAASAQSYYCSKIIQ